MEIKQIKGKKHEKDILLLITTEKDEPATMLKILLLIKFFFENEDRIYPHGRGRNMFFEAIQEIYEGKTLTEIAKEYKLDIKQAREIDEDIKNKKLFFFVR